MPLTLPVIEAGLVGPYVLLSVLVRSRTLPVGLARGPLALVIAIQTWYRHGQGDEKILTTTKVLTSGRDYLQQTATLRYHGSETY